MKTLGLWTSLLALATVSLCTVDGAYRAALAGTVCLPPSIPSLSALQPVGHRTAMFSQQGSAGHVRPIRIQQVKYVDVEAHEYVFSWYVPPSLTPDAPASFESAQSAILLGVDDDPDGPTPAWYDSGAATPTGYVRAEPQQACVWQRFRFSGDLQS